jgi:hypothetical protein
MSAVVNAAIEFLDSVDKLMVKEKCMPEQSSKMDETSQFWKWMPGRLYLLKKLSLLKKSKFLGF